MRIFLTCSIKPEGAKGEKDIYAEFDSKETIDDLADAIKSNGHEVEILNVLGDIKDKLNSKKENIDLVFNVAEGLVGEEREAYVPKLCEELKIPFTGASSWTAINTLNKGRTKEILNKKGIPTPKFRVVSDSEEDLSGLKFPLLVKPMFEGSSKGIFNENLVHDADNLKKIIKKTIARYNQKVIVEEFIDGREFTVSVIGEKTILPIVEILFDDLPDRLYPMDSYEVKWEHDSPESIEKKGYDPIVCPANIDNKLKIKIEEVVLATYKALKCHDWSRIDVRLDAKGNPNILEVNALPGFMKNPKENSRLPKAAYANRWSYERLIGEVINSAIKRMLKITRK